nr:polyadenylate-binding protein RBP45-like isoform X1 [Tanacetum cinerariifolium]
MIQQYGGGNSTLWIGDLQYWMDETYVYNCLSITGDVATVKLSKVDNPRDMVLLSSGVMPGPKCSPDLQWDTDAI